MLISLHVKNLALIEEAEVFFGEQLNILTGETGAGKSIIIGSINLALGGRADKDMIRTGAEYALLELTFQLDEEQSLVVRNMDIPVEEDGMVLIQRKIMPTRNVCKICGENATSHMVKELAELLLDMHGQHEHQSLFQIKKHKEFLDDFAKGELDSIKNILELQYTCYRKLEKELSAMVSDEKEREREIALAEFEAEEITKANLQPKEDEALEAAYRRMVNGKRIMEAVTKVVGLLASDNQGGAEDQIARALRELKPVLEYDVALAPLEEALLMIEELLQEFNHKLTDYITQTEFDDETFRSAESRLDDINRFKAKYGTTIEKILTYAALQEEKIVRLKDYEATRAELEKKAATAKLELERLCEQASQIRKRYAKELEHEMIDALLDLNFLDVRFEIAIRQKKDFFAKDGWDEVEFMIAANPGEPIKPLCDVASGGELSRIMLALKTVLAKKDEVPTLIFDEIDAGISGKTAWKVSEKLAILGKTHQVICITHLPQIAAMADTHFIIAKQTDGASTTTSIREIKQKEMVEELARMLGGETITNAVLQNANELKELATNTKQYQSKI